MGVWIRAGQAASDQGLCWVWGGGGGGWKVSDQKVVQLELVGLV